MVKTVLITGATDGIGLECAKRLVALGHNVLVHGRSTDKLAAVKTVLDGLTKGAPVQAYRADFAQLSEVAQLAEDIAADRVMLDVVINNAGVLKAPASVLANGLDLRFVVNTLAPFVLAMRLLPLLPPDGRVVNVSSAAQAPVNLAALNGGVRLGDMDAYAQSKLALTIWTREMAQSRPDGPMFVAVNPGSLLASKMVKEGFGLAGNDLAIGADVLTAAALSDRFAQASGLYFDNDAERFADPHAEALNLAKSAAVFQDIQALAEPYLA